MQHHGAIGHHVVPIAARVLGSLPPAEEGRLLGLTAGHSYWQVRAPAGCLMLPAAAHDGSPGLGPLPTHPPTPHPR